MASAITASAVVVVRQRGGEPDVVVVGQQRAGQEPPEESYIPPIKAVEEWTPKVPPGTPVAGLALPVDYGRFHFVAPETDPGPHVERPTPPPGVKKAGHDVKESASLDEFRGHDLFIEPPYIPAGWELVGTHAETVIWSDGSHTDSMFGLAYQRPQYFGIDIKRFLVAPDGRIRLVANPAAEVLYTLGEIRGVPVVYHRDLLQIHFVQGNVLTQIEAPVFDLDQLIKIADAMIAETEEPTAAAPAATAEPSPEPPAPPTTPQSTWGALGCVDCPVKASDQLRVSVEDIQLGPDGKYYVPDRGDGCAYREVEWGPGEGSSWATLYDPACEVFWVYRPVIGEVRAWTP